MYESRQAAIVIPVYKKELSLEEQISLAQAARALGAYDCYFVCPQLLVCGYKPDKIKEVRFDDKWFVSLRAYSELMLQKEFYQAFLDYEYVLLYQLDSFVFSDKLLEFCNQEYDYIGAPWIHGIAFYKDPGHMLHYVGNGGFSLRRVPAFLHWLEEVDLSGVSKTVNEDVLIAAYGPPVLRIPPVEEALRFAFDLDPRSCFEKNNRCLPFGCHAWQKIDLEFWRTHIEKYGYNTQDVGDSGLYENYRLRYRLEEERNIFLHKLCDKEMIVSFIRKLTKDDTKKLFIWGTGLWGRFIGQIFPGLGISIEGFIDNCTQGHPAIHAHRAGGLRPLRCEKRQEYLGYPVFRGIDFLAEQMDGRAVFLGVMHSEEIAVQIEHAGYIHYEDYMTLEDLLTDGE